MPDTPKAKIILFLVLTVAFSSWFWWLAARAAAGGANSPLIILGLMWCPGVAALLTRLVTQRNLAGQGWAPWPPGPLAIGYLLPLLYAGPVYLLVWATGLGGFNASAWNASAGAIGLAPGPAAGLLSLATLFMMQSLLGGTGEEIGWRGLLVPELARLTGFRNVALISGAIWACWHLPLILFAGYNSGTPLWFAIPCFGVMVIGLAAAAAWLRLQSGSLWPAAMLHASHNLFVQSVFDAATIDRGRTSWLTGEFGLGLAGTGALMGLWAVRRAARDRLIA